ncbi:18105_t:CDS:2 [Cetraspora pellucida]|uniref:18105_t:CDS:1 n=1 Tax=Cetraspora pellucida TaxID=1433469 RepID=A0ACA9K0G7_9GLOM|nr:18105_t:CDS:2 [Cetraspora pellucida]
MEGHNLPFETFFGWEGEKTPDIDLNFSGEYQKIAHNYVRQLLGEESVYRIGTINTLSQQTAEIFYREHLKLRKKLNSGFNEENPIRSRIEKNGEPKRVKKGRPGNLILALNGRPNSYELATGNHSYFIKLTASKEGFLRQK